jgi:hypothetical protein
VVRNQVDALSPYEPTFSRDGNWVAYVVDNDQDGADIRKVSVAGGAPVTVGSLRGQPYGASWRDHQIVFGENIDSVFAVRAVPDAGGTPRTLVSVDPKTERAVQPQLLAEAGTSFSAFPHPT